MKTTYNVKSFAQYCRRKIIIKEINILRNFELSAQIQDKISREMSKLHKLWFEDSMRIIR